MMSTKIVATLCGVLLAIGFVCGYYIGHKEQKIIRVPLFKGLLPIVVENANPDPTIPDEVYEIQDKPKVTTIPDCPVPSEWAPEYVVAERYPLQLTPKRATFTYFDPRSGSVMIDRFDIPQPLIRYELSAGVGATYLDMRQWPTLPTIDLRAEVGYKRIMGFGEVSIPVMRPEPIYTRVGIRYRFAGN